MAKQVADIVGYLYIDSGAMYRAVTLFALKSGAIVSGKLNKDLLFDQLNDIHLILDFDPERKVSVPILNGENVEKEIRSMEVAEMVSKVSEIKEVREKLVDLQQKMAENKGVVMDGRDIGTVVIPDAELKLFMTADPQVRAERRYSELLDKGEKVSYTEVLNNIKKRDDSDVNRDNSPLTQAEDAVILDNTHLTEEEQLAYTIGLINKLVTHKEQA